MDEERNDKGTGDGDGEIETPYTKSRKLWRDYLAGKLGADELSKRLGQYEDTGKEIKELFNGKECK